MPKVLENMNPKELLEAAKGLESQLKLSLSQNSAFESQLKSNESRLNQMQFQIDQMTRLLFGAKRERFIPEQDEKQLTLPFDVEEDKSVEKEQEVITYTRNKRKRENHPGRLPLPDHLPVEEIIIEPEEDTSGMKCIGKEVTDQLELIPAKLFIKRYIRPKYIKPEDDESLNYKGVIADTGTGDD
jgi:hypothetical protein